MPNLGPFPFVLSAAREAGGVSKHAQPRPSIRSLAALGFTQGERIMN
jgi:hypothetical protein